MAEQATTDQQARLVHKMIVQLEKQMKDASCCEVRQRYHEKLKKYTGKLNKLSPKPMQEVADLPDLDTTQSTLDSSTNHSGISFFDIPKSPASSPASSTTQLATPEPNHKHIRKLPFNIVHSRLDENGTRIIKLAYAENPLQE